MPLHAFLLCSAITMLALLLAWFNMHLEITSPARTPLLVASVILVLLDLAIILGSLSWFIKSYWRY
jgi:hypothetical protein